jgi:hypothetical protein
LEKIEENKAIRHQNQKNFYPIYAEYDDYYRHIIRSQGFHHNRRIIFITIFCSKTDRNGFHRNLKRNVFGHQLKDLNNKLQST